MAANKEAVMAEKNAPSGASAGGSVDAHDLLLAVEDMANRDPAFLKSLQNLMGGQPGLAHQRASGEDPLCPVLKRLGDVEKRLDGLSREMLHLQQNRPSHVDPEWTTGQGSGQRLTMKGMTEMNRLFEEGLSDTDIRGMMGVSLSTVGKRRRQYDKDVFQESLQSSAD